MKGDSGERIHQLIKKTGELTLTESELRYRRLFETTQDGILILDAVTGGITDVNPFLIKLLGYTRKEFVKKNLWEVGAFLDKEANQAAFEVLQKKKTIRYENLPLKSKDGRLIQVEFVSNVYKVGVDHVIQCNIRDITNRKKVEEALIKSEAVSRELSVRDYLTGLFNRRYMEETLERELLRAFRKQRPLGIIMLDVDEFKKYNDVFGHGLGDAILRELGNLLLRHVRREDIACRYGGDEFIIILPETPRRVTCERAELFCELASHLHIQFDGQTLQSIVLSKGVAAFPENGNDSTSLLKAVDKELYSAKNKKTEDAAGW